MQNRPTAAELLEAVRELLAGELLPTIQDDGLRFRVLIAANVLAVVERELIFGDPLRHAEWSRLCELLGAEMLESVADASTPNTVAALNIQLAATIRAEIDDSARIAPDGDLWQHVRQTLADQLAVANPKFVL